MTEDLLKHVSTGILQTLQLQVSWHAYCLHHGMRAYSEVDANFCLGQDEAKVEQVKDKQLLVEHLQAPTEVSVRTLGPWVTHPGVEVRISQYQHTRPLLSARF